jgi:hypothetical protein
MIKDDNDVLKSTFIEKDLKDIISKYVTMPFYICSSVY